MRRRLSRKRGGDGGLNSHIENYVKELNNENRENKLQEHKQLYLNAYARHNNVKSHVKSGFMGMNKKTNPVIEQSFNKRVENEKIRLEEEEELKRKQQEEIVARNLKKDKQKRIQHGVARKTMGLSKQRKQNEKDKLALMQARSEANKLGSRVIPLHMMPSSAASRYVDMKKASDTRGPSKLRGGKRRTRKRRSRKNKKSRKHKRNKKGRGIGPFGKQKPLSSDNKPKAGDKVRVRGEAGWTVIVPMHRAAIVCPPGDHRPPVTMAGKPLTPHQCDVQGETVRYSEMTKMGFMGQMGLKKRGGKKRKSRKAKKSRKRGKRGGMDDMCINYKHKLDGHSDYVNLAVVTQRANEYCYHRMRNSVCDPSNGQCVLYGRVGNNRYYYPSGYLVGPDMPFGSSVDLSSGVMHPGLLACGVEKNVSLENTKQVKRLRKVEKLRRV